MMLVLAAGRQVPNQTLFLLLSTRTVANLILHMYFEEVFQITTPTLAYHSTQSCTTYTKKACQAMKHPQDQMESLF